MKQLETATAGGVDLQPDAGSRLRLHIFTLFACIQTSAYKMSQTLFPPLVAICLHWLAQLV
jgi:hypothetical protein